MMGYPETMIHVDMAVVCDALEKTMVFAPQYPFECSTFLKPLNADT